MEIFSAVASGATMPSRRRPQHDRRGPNGRPILFDPAGLGVVNLSLLWLSVLSDITRVECRVAIVYLVS